MIYQGSITAEIFERWLIDVVLPQMEEGSIVVMDNAAIHQISHLRRLLEPRYYIEPLPPYSPDLNPIEESFSTLKSWIRRNRGLIGSFEDFGAFLSYAVDQYRDH